MTAPLVRRQTTTGSVCYKDREEASRQHGVDVQSSEIGDGRAADYIAQNEKAAIESIQTSATEGAMTGSAASKKQPTFEQFSRANITTLHWRNDGDGRACDQKRPRPSAPCSILLGELP
jgi:hypothetical protein